MVYQHIEHSLFTNIVNYNIYIYIYIYIYVCVCVCSILYKHLISFLCYFLCFKFFISFSLNLKMIVNYFSCMLFLFFFIPP